jgi:hypothetical protein
MANREQKGNGEKAKTKSREAEGSRTRFDFAEAYARNVIALLRPGLELSSSPAPPR